MSQDMSPPGRELLPPLPSRKLQRVLQLLSEAWQYAKELEREVWDFAVEIDTLRNAGTTPNDLRWLVGKGFVEVAVEVTLPDDAARVFRSVRRLLFMPRTCFILTVKGATFAASLPSNGTRTSSKIDGEFKVREFTAATLVPLWDRDRQELRLGPAVIKRYKVPAPNQEMILAAFEEEHWPARIDDPLPVNHGLEPKRRLHETITSLNRNQLERLIRFMGDGSGQGVRWERIESRAGS
jgi:hypothetical protein